MGKQMSVYMDEEVIEGVEEFAEVNDRSFSYVVNTFLKEQLKKLKKD